MTPVDLVRHDAQALAYERPEPSWREEPILPAEDEMRRRVRPCRERPGLFARRVRLAAVTAGNSFLGECSRDVVVEHGDRARVLALLGLPGRALEHLLRGFARRGHHPRDED